MKKKGFTLIELLAVIVVLAIIALIATPTILGVIEKAKQGAAQSSALGYIDAVEKQIAINVLDDTKANINDGSYTVEQLTNTYKVTVKGDKPLGTSWIKIANNKVVDYILMFKNYTIKYDSEKNTLVKTGPLMIPASSFDTHKGIVYLDPTDLSKTCNEANSVSTTETKTGCMKWYIYGEDESNYKMILDHNTTAKVAWNSSGKNTDGMSDILLKLDEDTKKWDTSLNAYIIDANEVAKITGNDLKNSWDATKSGMSWFCLDTNQADADGCAKEAGTSNYKWLFDYTNSCTGFGCDNNDSSNYGYWTSSPTAGNNTMAWRVHRNGNLTTLYISRSDSLGLRPVITILKSNLY